MAWLAIRTAVSSFDDVRHVLGQLSRRPSVKTVVANYTATGGEDVVLIDTTSNDVTVTLPDATRSEGAVYNVKWKADNGKQAYVSAAAGDVEGAAPPYSIASVQDSVTLVSDGTDWWIV